MVAVKQDTQLHRHFRLPARALNYRRPSVVHWSGKAATRSCIRALARRRWVAVVIFGCALGMNACTDRKSHADVAGTDKSLNLLTWSDTISPTTLARFEAQTGIKLRISYAVSNEDMETRLMTGHSGFDVVTPSADYLQRELQAGAYSPLTKAQLPHLSNMDPELMRKVAIHDPENAHATILMWGTDGIGYNEERIKRVLPNAPLDSWRLIFDPTVASTLSKCGIGMVDSAVDVMRAVLPYLGRDPNSQKPEDLAAAEDTLMKIRPYISHIDSRDYVQALANGELCVALGYSGDVSQARDRAREASTGIDVKYVIPKEGSIMWFMLLAIPNDARNVYAAHQFIDYLMTPTVSAEIANFSREPNANLAGVPLQLPAVREDPITHPSPEVRAHLAVPLPDSPEQLRAITRMWQRFKAGV
jgi:putrescine transport system substrate-binding protein